MISEHPDLTLDPTPTTPSLVPFSQRIKSLLPLLRAQSALVLVGATTPSSNPNPVDFVRKVESIEEASRVVREMENRSDQVEAALKKQNQSASARHQLGDGAGATDSVGVSSSYDDDDVEMQQQQQQEGDEDDPAAQNGAGTATAKATAVLQQQQQQLWTKRPIGTLPKGGVLALDLAPWPEQQQRQRTQVV